MMGPASGSERVRRLWQASCGEEPGDEGSQGVFRSSRVGADAAPIRLPKGGVAIACRLPALSAEGGQALQPQKQPLEATQAAAGRSRSQLSANRRPQPFAQGVLLGQPVRVLGRQAGRREAVGRPPSAMAQRAGDVGLPARHHRARLRMFLGLDKRPDGGAAEGEEQVAGQIGREYGLRRW